MDIGEKLGLYEIVAPLGAGGMGEVWRARDTKLDRDVAIKVLPDSMARDKERVLRFEREAKLLASLNHPSIAVIHGFDDADGTRFLVMEYVEGETLAQRLKGGAFAVEDALDVAKQMAEALEAAHEKGVVHRDLKPGNVMVRPDGTVKVLDFGLAKAMAEESSTSVPADSPTITANYTKPGVVLGTAAYMSPEQARGRALDKRTDIWSFGIIIYECLTGTTLFCGETATDSMGAILHKEPDWTQLPPSTPPTIQLLLRRCLTKDRNHRLHDIADARIELENAIADPTGLSLGFADAAGTGHSPSFQKLLGLVLLLLGVLFGLGGSYLTLRTSLDAPPTVGVIRFSLRLPEKTRVAGWASPMVAFSPDGRKIAFVAIHEGVQRLYIRHLDREEAMLVSGDEPVEGPFFSPDSEWVGYADGGISGKSSAPGKLIKVSVDGTIHQTICEIDDYFGAMWTDDGFIYYSGLQFILRRVHENGGTPSLAFPASANRLMWPNLLPGEDYALVTSLHGQIQSVNLSTGEFQDLGLAANYAVYVPSGHLAYTTFDGSVQTVPFDIATRSVRGTGVTVLSNVAVGCNSASAFAVSRTGSLLFVSGYLRDSGHDPSKIVRIGRDGQVLDLLVKATTLGEGIALSPDGKRLAIVQDRALWIHDLERKTRLKLPTGDAFSPENPLWSLDGERIVFTAGENFDLFIQYADGRRLPDSLLKRLGEQHASSWTPDGQTLAFASSYGPDNGILVLPMDGGEPRHLIPANGFLNRPMVSPDGRWIAYQTDSSGQTEVFLQTFPELSRKVPVSVDGGTDILWSQDGSEVFFRDGSRMMAVSVQTEPELHLSAPTMLFEAKDMRDVRLDADGNGFLMSMREPDSGIQTEVHIILNWLEELSVTIPTRENR